MSPAVTISQNKEVFQYHYRTKPVKLSEYKEVLIDRINEAGFHPKAMSFMVLEKVCSFFEGRQGGKGYNKVFNASAWTSW